MMQPVTYDDMVSGLRAVGLKEGSIALFHSFLGALGPTAKPVETLYAAFREVLGEAGTLVVPTFNFDFCRGKEFCLEATSSNCGVFTEYVRGLPEAKRSVNPIHSFTAVGQAAEDVLAATEKSSFGRGSVFGRLLDRGALLCFLGIGIHYCTFLHYVEEELGVPYRYHKEFRGTLRVGGQAYEDTYRMFVRDLEAGVEYSGYLFARELEEAGLVATGQVGRAIIRQVPMRVLYEFAKRSLERNPGILLAQP
jgi:aminoglycoside 3-N-acetyltransferase